MTDSDDDAGDDSSPITDPAGLIHLIVLNDSGHPDGPGESAVLAQDPGFEGSRQWVVLPQRPEVVLQESMTREPLYAKAGVIDEGKSILRNLHTGTFDAVAEFRQPGKATYWEDYGLLLRQVLEWLEGTLPGRPEIADISDALRALSERRTVRIAGRLRSCREGASEAQHLTSYPHGGYPPVPVEVLQVIMGGLSRGRNPALTVERLLKVFAHPVDDCTVEWLMLARFNGGILPGLAGETNIMDSSGGGEPLPFDHSYGPLMETVLHLIGHLF